MPDKVMTVAGHILVETGYFVNSDLWRLFPVINVDKTKDIPCDYPGAMGVPITFMDKFSPAQFELLGCISPRVNGRELYKRIVIRNLHPKLPEWIDLAEWLNRTGSKYEIVVEEQPGLEKREE